MIVEGADPWLSYLSDGIAVSLPLRDSTHERVSLLLHRRHVGVRRSNSSSLALLGIVGASSVEFVICFALGASGVEFDMIAWVVHRASNST
jgi:hypothetical protein